MNGIQIGQRFSRLTVTALISDKKNPKAQCICDCGSIVTPQRGALRNGRAKSCGCLRREILREHSESSRLPIEQLKSRRAERDRKWALLNPVRARQINNAATRRHYAKYPEKARENCRARRARLIGAYGVISSGIETTLHERQKGKCACCKSRLKVGNVHLDHVKPLVKGGLHEDLNLQLLCATCNLKKGARDSVDFMQSRGFLL